MGLGLGLASWAPHTASYLAPCELACCTPTHADPDCCITTTSYRKVHHLQFSLTLALTSVWARSRGGSRTRHLGLRVNTPWVHPCKPHSMCPTPVPMDATQEDSIAPFRRILWWACRFTSAPPHLPETSPSVCQTEEGLAERPSSGSGGSKQTRHQDTT